MVVVKTAFILMFISIAEANAAPPGGADTSFAPHSINSDDPKGKGAEWTKELPCGTNHASVTVKFDKAYENDGKYAPVGKIWLHSGQTGSSTEQWIAASLRAPTDTWKLNALGWLELVRGSDNGQFSGYGPVDLARPLHVDLTWTRDGIVKVRFGDDFTQQVSTDQPITGIGVGGSWSKFEFIDLRVEHVGNADPVCELWPIGKPVPSNSTN